MDVAGLAPGKVVGTNDDFRRFKGPKPTMFDSFIIRLGFQEAAGQKELFVQLLVPLLAEVGRCDDENAPFTIQEGGLYQSCKGYEEERRSEVGASAKERRRSHSRDVGT